MTIDQAYFEFVQLVNRNATNNNANIDKPRFVHLYNSVQTKYVEWILEKRNDDTIRYVSPLLVKGKELAKTGKGDQYDIFELPTDFFDVSSLQAYVGACKFRTFEIKDDDVEELYHDANHQPSLIYEETFYHTASNSVFIYTKDFEVTRATLSYYREPKEVDMSGYKKIDGSQSTTVHPELQDKAIGRILLAMAKQFSANNNDGAAYQLTKDQLFTIT